EISNGFKELCKVLNISYDDFIMTTEARHKKVAQHIANNLNNNGDIYKGVYAGPYCVDCETYYTKKDLVDGNCPVHKVPVDILKEESYFFRLSKYQKFLIEYLKDNPESIWPEKKRKEILNRLKVPLKDLSISRKEVKWGIPLPFDKKLIEFVWAEALNNYLTTIGYPEKKYENFWPATHVIGPDIVWHHTAIWFSILKSLKLDIPKVVVHGFINLKGEKLSKASGLRIDPVELARVYGTDALRYFLVRDIPFGDDGEFSEGALKERRSGELAGNLSNLVHRTLSLVEKFYDGNIPRGKNEINFDVKKIEDYVGEYELHNALAEIFNHVDKLNKYLDDKKPWSVEFNRVNVLYTVLDNIRIIAILLQAFMPETAEKLFCKLGVKKTGLDQAKSNLLKSGKVQKGEALFVGSWVK
ncbi:methionine--tRNA ligase, partial [Candidatus Woesearchaeota archaeon]|nr:methionine--tRNA ligase [Candidatus Woesearchaeota archaeon]